MPALVWPGYAGALAVTAPVEAMMEVMMAMMPRVAGMAEVAMARDRVKARIAMIEPRRLRGRHRKAERRKHRNS